MIRPGKAGNMAHFTCPRCGFRESVLPEGNIAGERLCPECNCPMRLRARGEHSAKVHLKCSRCGFRRAAPLGSEEAIKRVCPECGHRLRIGVRRQTHASPRRYDFQVAVGVFLLGVLVGPMLLQDFVTKIDPSANPELAGFLASVLAGVALAALVLGAVRALRR